MIEATVPTYSEEHCLSNNPQDDHAGYREFAFHMVKPSALPRWFVGKWAW
jgi:hypothetical protein